MSSFTEALVLELWKKGWRVVTPFRFYLRDVSILSEYVQVEAGDYTDLASVPIFRAHPSTRRAGATHDKTYRHPYVYRFRMDDGYPSSTRRRITRYEADRIFDEAMMVDGVVEKRRRLYYAGVRAFGWIAWNRYRRQEKAHQ